MSSRGKGEQPPVHASSSGGSGLAAAAPPSPPDAARGAAPAYDDAGPSTPFDEEPVLFDDEGFRLSAEAAASPFSPPATQRHAAFLKLVDSTTKAALEARHTRCADFAALAAEAGAQLFGDGSVIVARLRGEQAHHLYNQAGEEAKRGPAGMAEAEALIRRAWVVLLAQALPVLQRRIDKGTILPGTLRKVEEAFFVYHQQLIARVKGQPPPSAAALFGASGAFGYVTALYAVWAALDLLRLLAWRGDQRERVQGFVLDALRLIPATAGVRHQIGTEHRLVTCVESDMNPTRHGAEFCASVLAVWRSPAVADVLRARGSLQVGATAVTVEARKQADMAKGGLWRCGLPSCVRQESAVLQFRVCGHCQRTRYCCPEHATQHWRVHKMASVAGDQGEASGGGGGAA